MRAACHTARPIRPDTPPVHLPPFAPSRRAATARQPGRLPAIALAAALLPFATPAPHAAGLPHAPAAASTHAPRAATLPDAAGQLARFHALLDADWEWQMQQSPEYATELGDHRYDDRLTDASPAAVERREAHDRAQLAALKKLDRGAFSGEERISYDFALYQAESAVEFQRFPALRTRVLSAVDGLQLGLPSTMRDMPIRSELDARHALARLQAMPARIAQDIAWLRAGKRLGWVTFKASLSKVPDEIDGLLARPVAENPLFDPFTRLPADLPEERRRALHDAAEATLRDQVFPAFVALRQVVVDELLPASPDDGAMSAYPDGAAIYKLEMRDQTTLPLGAQAVHDIGLAEVARLHGLIADVMRQMGFGGTYVEFVETMNHDPKYFYTKAEDLLAGYRDIAKRVDPALTRLFLVLPRTPYGIRPIPEYQGANASEFYTGGAADASSPGWFNANVVALAQRPQWEMEALFLHEGVPGHHLQVSRAHELAQLPVFRRVAGPNAYVEGWALYSEGLGGELGLYTDPASRYGQLRMEIFRAGRLVVDTGIHALGWTRAQAIAYMVDNTGIAREDATAEVDRYFAWPGQALGYKLGQMKILELRRNARAALGERFDLRAFHQEVLDHGALPLPVLDRVIQDWVARVKAAAPAAH